MVETQCGITATMKSLDDENGQEIHGQEKMCKAFYKHFAMLFVRNEILDTQH